MLSTVKELGIYTIAIYTADDPNHALYADEAVLLESPSDFTDAAKIISICLASNVDSVHPAYGFLSENARFCEILEQAKIMFVGPNSAVLRQVSEKTTARNLAEANNVPVLPALAESITELDEATAFIAKTGFPIMIKAVDGGGGRGIRLVNGPEDLKQGFARACGESPSGRVFIEKAAIQGYRHVEVQILGDQYGEVGHLWERECSIQRRLVTSECQGYKNVKANLCRFQKVVELAPSTIQNRELISEVIRSAMRMAKAVSTLDATSQTCHVLTRFPRSSIRPLVHSNSSSTNPGRNFIFWRLIPDYKSNTLLLNSFPTLILFNCNYS